MDIGALSMIMSQSRVQQSVGIEVMNSKWVQKHVPTKGSDPWDKM